MQKLMVNIDHIATLREARGVSYPDPLHAACGGTGVGDARALIICMFTISFCISSLPRESSGLN